MIGPLGERLWKLAQMPRYVAMKTNIGSQFEMNNIKVVNENL